MNPSNPVAAWETVAEVYARKRECTWEIWFKNASDEELEYELRLRLGTKRRRTRQHLGPDPDIKARGEGLSEFEEAGGNDIFCFNNCTKRAREPSKSNNLRS